ncbi:DUF962 domain-containing protein [bacterium]|nr:DUF962 domain-containing protein [bacterium]
MQTHGKSPVPDFSSFAEFYPFYLKEHSRRGTRVLHFYGTAFGLFLGLIALYTFRLRFAVLGIVGAYAMAWIGHFFIEKNRPATFRYPLYSFMGDWRLFYEILIGKQRF